MTRRVPRLVAFLILPACLSGCAQPLAWLDAWKLMGIVRKHWPAGQDLAHALARVDDTARIVYAAMSNGQSQIFTVQPDGERSVQITMDPGYKCKPMWSPDHRYIACFRYANDRPVGDEVSIMLMEANGARARDVVRRLKINRESARLSWKPDGRRIYVQEKDFPTILFGYSALSGKQAETVRLPKQSFLQVAHTLSPNLEMLAGAGRDPKSGIMHIGTVFRNGRSDTDLMQPFSKAPYHTGTVVWSYDSRLVAFELDNLIIVMSSSFGPDFKAYPLTPMETNVQLSEPAFSPTGKYIACIMEKTREEQMGLGNKEVSSDVWIMNVDGSQQRQLTHSGTCFDPHW